MDEFDEPSCEGWLGAEENGSVLSLEVLGQGEQECKVDSGEQRAEGEGADKQGRDGFRQVK